MVSNWRILTLSGVRGVEALGALPRLEVRDDLVGGQGMADLGGCRQRLPRLPVRPVVVPKEADIRKGGPIKEVQRHLW